MGRHRVHYLRQPFQREPDFGVTSVNYKLDELISRAEEAGVTANQGPDTTYRPNHRVRSGESKATWFLNRSA